MPFCDSVLFSFLVVALAVACREREKGTYKPGRETNAGTDSRINNLRDQWGQVPPPALPVEYDWQHGWRFEVGEFPDHLDEPCRKVEGDSVALPHRVLQPNRALWYVRVVRFPARGVIRIGADDGAQLFINGRRQLRLHDHVFPVDSGGTFEITIRVLNNAMSGGLRSVTFSTHAAYQAYLARYARWQQINEWVLRASRLENPADRMIQSVLGVIQDTSAKAMHDARRMWAAYPYIYGAWILRPSEDSLQVRALVETDVPVEVRYGFNRNELSALQQGRGPLIAFSLSFPKTADTVFYQLVAANVKTPLYAARVKADQSFQFHVWGDSQSGWDVFSQHMQNLATAPDAFGVAVGDLVGNGSSGEEWKSFLRIACGAASRMPYYFVPGNHDYDGYYDDLRPVWFNTLFGDVPHHRMWTYANCAFLSLDLNDAFPIHISDETEQGRWFARQIEQPAWQRADWRFVFVHHPPYSQGWAGYEGELVLRNFLERRMADARIDFVVSGHTHDYERLTKTYPEGRTTYLVVGGAGGSLEPPDSSPQPRMDTVIKRHHIGRFRVQGRRAEFQAVGPDQTVLDSFVQLK